LKKIFKFYSHLKLQYIKAKNFDILAEEKEKMNFHDIVKMFNDFKEAFHPLIKKEFIIWFKIKFNSKITYPNFKIFLYLVSQLISKEMGLNLNKKDSLILLYKKLGIFDDSYLLTLSSRNKGKNLNLFTKKKVLHKSPSLSRSMLKPIKNI